MPSVQTNQTAVPFLDWHAPERRTSDMVLIAVSGGSYMSNGIDWFEVVPVRDYFLSKGVIVVRMQYRCPRPVGLAKHVTAWQDAQRTVRLVRHEARMRGLDPEKIGFTGCSAGGHLALMVATSSQTPAYAPVDEIDREPCHVNFAVPVYPAYVLEPESNRCNVVGCDDLSARLVPELAFDAKTPPMCFIHGDGDDWSAMGSVRAYHRLRTMRIPAELHVMAHEPHCFQASPRLDSPSASWKDRVWEWLNVMGFATVHPDCRAKGWRNAIARGAHVTTLPGLVRGYDASVWPEIADGVIRVGARPMELKDCWSAVDFEYAAPADAPGALELRTGDAVVRTLPLAAERPEGWNRVTLWLDAGRAKLAVNGRIALEETHPEDGMRVAFRGAADEKAIRLRNMELRK